MFNIFKLSFLFIFKTKAIQYLCCIYVFKQITFFSGIKLFSILENRAYMPSNILDYEPELEPEPKVDRDRDFFVKCFLQFCVTVRFFCHISVIIQSDFSQNFSQILFKLFNFTSQYGFNVNNSIASQERNFVLVFPSLKTLIISWQKSRLLVRLFTSILFSLS